MRDAFLRLNRRAAAAWLAALLIVAAPAWAQQGQQRASQSTSKDREQSGEKKESKDEESFVRHYGSEGGYRTELNTHAKGKLTSEDRRQIALLMAQGFEHVDKARIAIDADDSKAALREVYKAREAIRTVREILPKLEVRTRTVGPDGKTVFEDSYETQDGRVALFEGMLHSQTLAPILAARRNALDVVGLRVVQAETVVTEAIADIEPLDAYLARAAKALEQNKTEEAAKALAMALVRGLDFRYRKEDTELASARDAMWLARRALEENNSAQALVNLAIARQRLRLYREILSADQRQEVDQMLREIEQLEAQLRQESARTQTASRTERLNQSARVTHWWDRVNEWFRRHL